ncbi:MAG: 60S ribosomal export protein NMD3 [Candidatus Methanomethylophilaceae archaeon]
MRFCVKCGKDVEKTMGGLCTDCYLDGRKFTALPHHVDLDVCAVCGEYYLDRKWVPSGKRKAAEDAAVEQLGVLNGGRVKFVETFSEEQDPRIYVVKVISELTVQDVEVESEASTIVRIKNTVCKRCSRVQGSYYESILQVRSEERAVDEDTVVNIVNMVMSYVDQQSKVNRQYFVSKVEKMHGGVDFYLSSISLGRTIAKMVSDKYSGENKESAKLVGRTDDGQDMYRITYLVRLPEFKVGDVVIFNGKHYKLARVFSTGGRLLSLKDFKEVTLRRSDMPTLKVYRKRSELKDATVVSGEYPEIQILDPLNFSTVELRVPEGAMIGETVKVTDIDGVLYYVP